MSNANTAITHGPSAATVRQGFDEQSIERTGETAQTSLSARATAEVQARFLMAMKRPRDDDLVRERLLAACRRPAFARSAFYSVERGNKPGRLTGTMGRIEGLSVRFADEAIRLAGNLERSSRVLYEDDFRRSLWVQVLDLETNASHGTEFVMSKTVERKAAKLRDGAVVLGRRTNTYGEEVCIVQATDDELFQKQNNLTSKSYRSLGLALIPPDTKEACEQLIILTWRDEDAKDPEGNRKRLISEFASLGVPADQLKEYMGHDGTRMTADERLSLGGLRAAILDGEVSWADVLSEKRASRGVPADGKAAASTVSEKIQAKADELRAKAEAKKKEKAAAAPAATAKASASTDADAPPPDDVVLDGERQPGEEG